jgi:hypothetical protein
MIWTRTELVLRFAGARGFFAGAFLDFLAWGFLGFLGIFVYLYEVKFFIDLAACTVEKHEIIFSVEYEPHKVLRSFFGELHDLLENFVKLDLIPWFIGD